MLRVRRRLRKEGIAVTFYHDVSLCIRELAALLRVDWLKELGTQMDHPARD